MSVNTEELRQGINHAKGKVGALSRSRAANDPALVTARQELAAAKLAAYVSKVVSEAPPLSAEQLNRVAVLLRGGAA